MRTPQLTPIVRAIIVINVIVFIVQSINPQYDSMIDSLFGLHYFTSEKFNPIQLVTYMFVHGGINHIFSNMLGLFFLGPTLERLWGEKRFLIFYFVTGVGAGVFYMALKYYDIHPLEALANNFLLNPEGNNFVAFVNKLYSNLGVVGNPLKVESNLVIATDQISEYKIAIEKFLKDVVDTPMVGASGAGFGIMAAFGLLFPNTEFMLFPFPFPVKAKYFVTFYALYEIYAGIKRMPGDNIAHFAHIGGMIFAFILIKMWGSKRDNFY
jgi:membrane associated rhomboid family serine protease